MTIAGGSPLNKPKETAKKGDSSKVLADAAAKKAVAEKQADADKPRTITDNVSPEYIAKVGAQTYALSRGELMLSPIQPEIRCSTRKYSQVRFIINDPLAVYFAETRKESDVSVSFGFQGGKIVEKFKGKVKTIGRVEPNGTLIIAIDNLASLSSATAAGTSDAGAVPAADGRKTELDRSKRKISKTLNYAAIEMARLTKDAKLVDGTKYDPAKLVVFTNSLPAKSTVTISIDGAPAFVDAVVVAETPVPGRSKNGSASKLVLSESAYNQVTALPNKPKKPFKLEVYTVPPTPAATGKASTTEQAVLGKTDLKYSKQTPYSPAKDGGSTLQQTPAQKIVQDATSRGDVVIATGDTIKEISADSASKTKINLVLDYNRGRTSFIGYPIMTIRTPLAVNSGVGTLTVNGWNVNNKESITATTSTPVSDGSLPVVKVFASPTGSLKPGDLIYPGSMYTWGDATYGGIRVPATVEISNSIIRIAQILTFYTQKVGKGKWKITSWYRRPQDRPANGASDSRHNYGDAADFVFDGMFEFYEQVRKEWAGGVAKMDPDKARGTSGFVHLDDRPKNRNPNPANSGKTGENARWIYGAGGRAV